MWAIAHAGSSRRAAAAAGLLLALVAALAAHRIVQPNVAPAPVAFSSGPQFSLAHPGAPFPRHVLLRAAERKFGPGPIVLPALPAANSANIGQVWRKAPPRARRTQVMRAVEIVFPRARVAVAHFRAAYPDPLDNYRGYVSEGEPGAADVVHLGGAPALLIHRRGDPLREPGSVEFVADWVAISVIGRRSDAFLLAVAASIHNAAARS